MDSPVKKEGVYDVTVTAPTDTRVGTTEYGETEVFVTGADGVNFRTVGWIRGIFTHLTQGSEMLTRIP